MKENSKGKKLTVLLLIVGLKKKSKILHFFFVLTMFVCFFWQTLKPTDSLIFQCTCRCLGHQDGCPCPQRILLISWIPGDLTTEPHGTKGITVRLLWKYSVHASRPFLIYFQNLSVSKCNVHCWLLKRFELYMCG